MPTPKETAESFCELNFHDDTLIDLRVLPQHREEGMKSVVEIQLHQYSQDKMRIIQFFGCTNLRVAMDFDVLADNLSPNTSSVDAHTDLNQMRNLIQSQEKDLDVNYRGSSRSPITTKLAELGELVFFRVQFFGGAIDVIARQYEIKTTSTQTDVKINFPK